MKARALALLAISIALICIIRMYPVSALDQTDLSLSPAWSTVMFYQGDVATVKIILSNNSSELLTVYSVGIHFDWMDEDAFAGRDLSDDPTVVASHSVYVFDPMTINIPSDVSVDEHNYTIGIEVSEGASSTVVPWDSAVYNIYVQAAGAKSFRELALNVSTKISEGINATYQSPEAKSLLDQANAEYEQAFLLSVKDQWDEALTHLNTAYSYAEQAAEAEQQYIQQAANLQQLLLIIAPIVTVVIVAVIIILVWRRRRKPNTEDYEQPTDQTYDDEQPYDDQPETQDYTTEE